jgi:hypothetical protein
MSTQLKEALRLIDEAHSRDPTTITSSSGSTIPYELHYAQKCTHYLTLRAPSDPPSSTSTSAAETLQLAVRAQHLQRWEIPRSSYPMTKPGYHSWRTFLKKRQGELAAGYCIQAGYREEDAARVAALIRKEDLKKDEETMVLEDVACLVFLDDQFEEFEKSMDEEKVITVLRKTWGKMSEKGRELALGMGLEGRPKELIEKALAG